MNLLMYQIKKLLIAIFPVPLTLSFAFPDGQSKQPPLVYLEQKASLRENWHPALKDIKKVKILINVSNEDTDTFKPVFKNVVERAFYQLGIPPSKEGEAVVVIEVYCQPLGKEYGEKGFLYTGAHIKGKIRLETQTNYSLERNFEGFINPPPEPPTEVEGKPLSFYKEPANAIIEAMKLKSSFLEKFFEIYYEAFGTSAVFSFYTNICFNWPYFGPSEAVEDFIASLGEKIVDILLPLLREIRYPHIVLLTARILSKLERAEVVRPLLVLVCQGYSTAKEARELLDSLLRNSCFKEKMANELLKILEEPMEWDKEERELASLKRLALQMLVSMKEKRVVEPAVKILTHEEGTSQIVWYSGLKIACAEALGELGDSSHIELLDKLAGRIDSLDYASAKARDKLIA